MTACQNNYIRRKGYTRKDAKGKTIRVKSKCIKSTRSPGYRNQKRSQWAKKYLAAKKKSRSKSVRCRPGYTKRSSAVKATCIRDKKRKKSKSKSHKKKLVKIGPLNKGTLRKFGYHSADGTVTRRKALAAAVKRIGWLPVFRKLNAVSVLTKRTNPKKSMIFKRDKDWVRKNYY
jgi:hypothetical protein